MLTLTCGLSLHFHFIRFLNTLDLFSCSFWIEYVAGSIDRALARKLKLLTFSQNWGIRILSTKGRHYSWRQEKKLVQPIERWKTPSCERSISEHDILQITAEKCFFFVYHKLGGDMEWKEIDRLILVR